MDLLHKGERKLRWTCYAGGEKTQMDLLCWGRENQDGLAIQGERKVRWTSYTRGEKSKMDLLCWGREN